MQGQAGLGTEGVTVLGSVDARSLAELRGISLAMKAVPRDVRNAINRNVRAEATPIWKEELGRKTNALPHVDQLVLGKGTRVKAGNPTTLVAAASTRPLSGGLVPTQKAKSFEFGTDDREGTTTYTRRNRRTGGSHQVTRRTKRQLPVRSATGHAIWPAWAESGPRLVSLQVQTVVRIINESLGN